MYEYQQSGRYFAQSADDIKDIVEAELLELGAVETSPSYRGIYFNADPESLYRINLHSRLINRVLAPLKTFDCHSDNYLYKVAKQITWEDFLSHEQTLAVFANNSAATYSVNTKPFAARAPNALPPAPKAFPTLLFVDGAIPACNKAPTILLKFISASSCVNDYTAISNARNK